MKEKIFLFLSMSSLSYGASHHNSGTTISFSYSSSHPAATAIGFVCGGYISRLEFRVDLPEFTPSIDVILIHFDDTGTASVAEAGDVADRSAIRMLLFIIALFLLSLALSRVAIPAVFPLSGSLAALPFRFCKRQVGIFLFLYRSKYVYPDDALIIIVPENVQTCSSAERPERQSRSFSHNC